MDPKIFYRSTIDTNIAARKKLTKKKSFLSVLRLGSIVAIILVFYFLWGMGAGYVICTALALLFIFFQLVYRDIANKNAINNLSRLIQINEDEINALEGHYFHFKDGASLLPKEHYYANDMDVLGHASLYQFINRTTSEMGAAQLANWLLQPATTENILQRQQAVKELKDKTTWRLQLQSYGIENPIQNNTRNRLLDWVKAPAIFLQYKPWQWLRYLLPAIILFITASVIFDFLSMNVFYVALLLYAVIAFQINKVVAPMHEQLSKMVDELSTLGKSIAWIEKENFTSPMLMQLKQQFTDGQQHASKKIHTLNKILGRLDLRYNMVLSAPFNLFLLWNLQQAIDVEQWKKQYAVDLQQWFIALGIFESLHSFASIHFNNPSWVFPSLLEKHFSIEAGNLGHPLINEEKRVNNFLKIERDSTIMLVTGSNMAGKSTYLRSVGINVILAMAGAPVCAGSFLFSPVQLISSMRIADNLEESTSTFYAELKKLKAVIDKVNNNEKVFILLDEILRGTNSMDRHKGSEAFIKQLIKQHAVAIVATHDIALADIKKEYPQNIVNYHFDVQVSKEELYFDYLLKPGICNSMNASILMKKIGIEL